MPQRVGHSVLTLLSGQLQNLHVHFVGHFLGMGGSQRVPCHAKTTGRKHLFAVSVVGEGSRFSHERIDDVTVIDGSQLLADQSPTTRVTSTRISPRTRSGHGEILMRKASETNVKLEDHRISDTSLPHKSTKPR
jgi:hypothetical protein